jgi:hypothetical protein
MSLACLDHAANRTSLLKGIAHADDEAIAGSKSPRLHDHLVAGLLKLPGHYPAQARSALV